MEIPNTATHALINVNPTNDELIASMHNEALRAQEYAEARVILTDEDAKLAGDDLVIISRLKKGMDAKLKEYTDPINEHLKTIRDTFKMLMGPVLAADATTREKVLAYRQEQERKAREITEINRLRLEAAQKEAALSGTGEISESVVILDAPTLPGKTVTTDNGAVTTRKNWHAKVTDFKVLPDEYKIPNQQMLDMLARQISKNGKPTIPGVEFYQEESLAATAR